MRCVFAMMTAGLVGCGVEGGVGQSSGRLTLTDTETGEIHDVSFDGGALAFDDALGHHLAITSWGLNFHCEYARVLLSGQAGPDVDRRRPHFELYWVDSNPTSILVSQRNESLFGSSSSGAWFDLTGEIAFSDEAETVGTLSTDVGELVFDAEDCGSF